MIGGFVHLILTVVIVSATLNMMVVLMIVVVRIITVAWLPVFASSVKECGTEACKFLWNLKILRACKNFCVI